MDIITRVDRVGFHAVGGRFQSAPKFVVAFSGRTPVAIIEVVVLCLYVSFILFNSVRTADKNGGIGDGVSDGSGKGASDHRMEQLGFIGSGCLMHFNLIGVVIMQIRMLVVIILLLACDMA